MTALFVAFSSLLIAVLAIAMLGSSAVRLATPMRTSTFEGWRQHRSHTATASQSPRTPDYSRFPLIQFAVSRNCELIAKLEFSRI